MMNTSDFMIENGVLRRYNGPGGDVVIPEGVTAIGNFAFSDCEGLTSVTIPDGVKEIGHFAFSNCKGLTSVTIPDGVREINSYAFSGCTSLAGVTIPNSVKEIGYYAFSGCTSLTSVEVAPENQQFYVENGLVISRKESSVILVPGGLTSAVIPEGVKEIDGAAFRDCTNLTSVTIPNSVKEIGDSAFRGCESLTRVAIPSSVKEIGYYAFSGCTSLTSVEVAPENQQFYVENGLVISRKESSVILVPGGLTSAVIPEGVKEIDGAAFRDCTNLTSVTIPEGVSWIGSSAFSGCTGLTSVTIPEGVTTIGSSAFSGCTGLTSVTIPESVTEIGDVAFRGCTGLTNVTIPVSVTKIGEWAFSGCTGLTSITIPESVTEVGTDAFGKTPWLEQQKAEHDMVYAGRCVVACRETLVHADIREGTERICKGAFFGCTALTGVTIPASVTRIDSNAFSGCTGLTSVIIPEGVAEIESDAFSGCTGLTNVTIPASVTRIDSNAFSGCTGLTNVTIPESVTGIGQEAFSGCTGLASITIPTSVAKIGPYAFQGCTGLTSLTLSEGIAVIDRCAFEGCTGLTGITIPAGVTEIGCSAFSACTALREVTFLGMPSMLHQEVFSGADANLVLHTPDTLITQLPSGYKQAAARDFAKRYISGAELPEAYRADCLKYIKGQKKKLYPLALRFPALLHVMLAEQIVPKGDIPDLTDQAAAVGNAESTAMLLEYQSKQITPEERQALEAEKIQREMDFMLTGTLTVAEAKKSWRYEKDLEGNLCILGYKGREAEIYVPAVIGKNPVTAIDNYAFSPNASHLTEALRTVRREIRAIYLPEGIIQIGRGAFEGCEKLERIHIPANVRKIGSCSMVGRTITRKLTTDNPFAACPSLRELTVDEENQYYLLRDGLLLKRSKKGEVLLGCMEPIQGVCVIPEGTKKIPPECFLDCVDMTGVSLPKRLEKIGTASFSGCKSLTEIHIPDHVTTIDAGAFYGCTSLTNVSIPGSVTKIDGWAFHGCKHLTIHAPAGSYAQQYAEANGHPFVAR